MNELNTIPQVAVALGIIWLVVSGCCLLALTSFARSLSKTLADWHEEWLYIQNGHPKKTEKVDMKDPKARMARAGRKKKDDDDD